MRYLLFIILTLPLAALGQENKQANAKEAPKTPAIRITCAARAISDTPLIIINDYPLHFANLQNIHPNQIASIHVSKGAKAISQYGEKGKFGVINLTVKPEALKQLIEKGIIKLIL